MRMKCHHCNYEWNYRGHSIYYITCPRCLRKIKANAGKPTLMPTPNREVGNDD